MKRFLLLYIIYRGEGFWFRLFGVRDDVRKEKLFIIIGFRWKFFKDRGYREVYNILGITFYVMLLGLVFFFYGVIDLEVVKF